MFLARKMRKPNPFSDIQHSSNQAQDTKPLSVDRMVFGVLRYKPVVLVSAVMAVAIEKKSRLRKSRIQLWNFSKVSS